MWRRCLVVVALGVIAVALSTREASAQFYGFNFGDTVPSVNMTLGAGGGALPNYQSAAAPILNQQANNQAIASGINQLEGQVGGGGGGGGAGVGRYFMNYSRHFRNYSHYYSGLR